MKSKSSILPNEFSGFYKETFQIFSDLHKNNSLEWYRNNKPKFEEFVLNPSKALIKDVGQFIEHINPSIRIEPKYNVTMMRIHKDQRFHKGDPLREFFLIHFGRYKMDSEFYIYFDKSSFEIGVFINSGDPNSNFNENIQKFNSDFHKICKENKINNTFQLGKLSPEPKTLKKKFDSEKDFDILSKEKLILISKNYDLNNKVIYTKKLSIEVINKFVQLYPLLVFCYSKKPLSSINS